MNPEVETKLTTEYTKYHVESCGTTLEITPRKDIAIDIYSKAVGPEVSVLGQDSAGNLHTLYKRTRGGNS